MGKTPFAGCPALTIHAPADSYAKRYAKEQGIPFRLDAAEENRPCLTAPDLVENGVLTIPEGVTEIEPQAFAERTDLTGVVFPTSLREIGNSAFYGCKGLKRVSFPDGLREIGAWAFFWLLCSDQPADSGRGDRNQNGNLLQMCGTDGGTDSGRGD